MDNYRLHQFIASASVAVFILCVALCILVCNRSVYEKTNKEYRASLNLDSTQWTEYEKPLTEFESYINYTQIADSFTSFFGKSYKLVGYELSKDNVKKLGTLKVYYRWAWVFAVLSVVVAMRSFMILSKRRLYMPLIYGGIGAVALTGILTLIMRLSNSGMAGHIKDMVFLRDYSYFSGNDILLKIIPPGFAGGLMIFYVLTVIGLALFMAFLRWFIIFCGRPHRF